MRKEQASLYRVEKMDNLLVFQANYHHFQFSRHSHEEFALGVMEEGVQKFHCRGQDCYATKGSLITVNVDEIHDGMSADRDVYRYRIIYIPFPLMQKIGVEMVSARRNHYFAQPVTEDPVLADRLRFFFTLLEKEEIDVLEAQSIFYSLLGDLLGKHGTEQASPDCIIPEAVDKASNFINDMACHNITLDDIAAAAGLSRFHFLRIFRASKGLPPHSFLLHRRLQLARESIRRGASISDAALATCFSDQSHFSRRFRSAYGITPKQYQKAVS